VTNTMNNRRSVAEKKDELTRDKMIQLPTNSNTQRVVTKVKQLVKGIRDKVQESISRNFFPNTIHALNLFISTLEKIEEKKEKREPSLQTTTTQTQ